MMHRTDRRQRRKVREPFFVPPLGTHLTISEDEVYLLPLVRIEAVLGEFLEHPERVLIDGIRLVTK